MGAGWGRFGAEGVTDMRPIHLVLLVLPVMAACATTPRSQCEAPYRAELRTVEADLQDTAEVLARGYRLVPTRSRHGVHHCVTRTGFVRLCTPEDGEAMFDKRPISRAAETAKLAALQAEQKRLEAAIAACRAQYPE